MTKHVNRVAYEKKLQRQSHIAIAQEEDQTLMEEIWRDDNHETFRHFPTKTGPHSRVIFIVMSYSNCHKKCCPGSGVARQRILVSYLVIFWHILSYFHITVRNWRPQHINYDTKRVLANELETQHFVQIWYFCTV